jgi:hypothetical protein
MYLRTLKVPLDLQAAAPAEQAHQPVEPDAEPAPLGFRTGNPPGKSTTYATNWVRSAEPLRPAWSRAMPSQNRPWNGSYRLGRKLAGG